MPAVCTLVSEPDPRTRSRVWLRDYVYTPVVVCLRKVQIGPQHESLINNSKACAHCPGIHESDFFTTIWYMYIYTFTSMWCTFANHLLTNARTCGAYTHTCTCGRCGLGLVFFLFLMVYEFLGVDGRRNLEEGEGTGSREKLNERCKQNEEGGE